MKINIKDYKNRKHLSQEIAVSLNKVINYLNIDTSKIKQVNIVVLKDFPTAEGYDKAFARLYQNQEVNLIINPSYDQNQNTRLSLLAHELTHVKQMINQELIFSLNGKQKTYLYKNKQYTKVYSFAVFDSLCEDREAQINYISKICPWEEEPSRVADFLCQE